LKRRISIARKLARRGRRAGLGLALLSGFAASAHAFDDKWTGAASNQWSNATNWSTGLPVSTDTVTSTSTTNNPVVISGILTITGNYTDPPSSHLFIQIGGLDPFHGLSQLDVGGTANLNDGTLDVSPINGFMPTDGELFVILTSGGLPGTFNNDTIVDGNVTFHVEHSPRGFANDVVLGHRQLGRARAGQRRHAGRRRRGLLAYGRHRRRRAGA
jgi:hypothetical protein